MRTVRSAAATRNRGRPRLAWLLLLILLALLALSLGEVAAAGRRDERNLTGPDASGLAGASDALATSGAFDDEIDEDDEDEVDDDEVDDDDLDDLDELDDAGKVRRDHHDRPATAATDEPATKSPENVGRVEARVESERDDLAAANGLEESERDDLAAANAFDDLGDDLATANDFDELAPAEREDAAAALAFASLEAADDRDAQWPATGATDARAAALARRHSRLGRFDVTLTWRRTEPISSPRRDEVWLYGTWRL